MHEPPDIDRPTGDLGPIRALIRARRSVKPALMDAGRDIPQALLDSVFECANWAPTHGLTEPWRFRVYRGEARRDLAAALQRIYREATPAAEFRADKFEKLGVNPLLAPAVAIIWMKRGDNPKIPEIEEIEAVACAVQNAHLAASAAGLGAFWSSPPLFYTPQIRAWMGIGEGDRALGLLYLGWPREGASIPAGFRRPASEKVEWVG